MFHLAAYFATTGPVTNGDIPALRDDVLFIQNNHFVYPADLHLFWAYCGAASLTRARINSPKLRQISPWYLRPISVGLLPSTNPNIALANDQPLALRINEEVALEVTDTVGTTENLYGLIAVGDAIMPVPQGDFYNLRVTHGTTVVASNWTTVSLTYEQQLPVGRYAVIGGEYFSTTAVAFRLILDQQYMRPGMIAFQSAGGRLPYIIGTRDLGIWGYFQTTSLPRMQVLCNAADTSGEGYIQVVKVA